MNPPKNEVIVVFFTQCYLERQQDYNYLFKTNQTFGSHYLILCLWKITPKWPTGRAWMVREMSLLSVSEVFSNFDSYI